MWATRVTHYTCGRSNKKEEKKAGDIEKGSEKEWRAEKAKDGEGEG